MTRNEAIDFLKAVACCTVTELRCSDCPLYDEQTYRCRPWHDSEVVEAVRTLNKEADA